MPPRVSAQASIIIVLLAIVDARWPQASFDPTPAAAQDAPHTVGRASDKISVGRPVWRLGSGLLYGAITLRNANPFAVWKVIIACDFFDEWGNPIGTRATQIQRVFSPGRTRVSGLYFSAVLRKTVGGACRPVSAEPFPRPGPTS
jgi:hypothetical protein